MKSSLPDYSMNILFGLFFMTMGFFSEFGTEIIAKVQYV